MRRLRSWFVLVALCACVMYGMYVVNTTLGSRRILDVVGDPLATQVVSQAWGEYVCLEFPDIDSVVASNSSSLRSSSLRVGLLALVDEGNSDEIRRRSVYALGEIAIASGSSDESLLELLRILSSNDSDWGVREEAKLSLSKVRQMPNAAGPIN